MTDPTAVHHDQARQRYRISADGEAAGFTAYLDRGDQRVFHHTEIDDRFRGRGLSGALLAEALADTRARGLRIVPVCPRVAGFLRGHPEFADVTDQPTPEVLRWLEAELP
ncbi:GNAT family N-acetyltransferase [Saccharopolyspora rosea]|uniref:GNAT family N-acetyltransferase n=1 Tax=Saccharopolyspora rosea TaxID=524884 RepID=A0ABW3FSQ8_9PSEU|nr:GNAT family N-acetyltransferase [Saccharopolyspora rosea]